MTDQPREVPDKDAQLVAQSVLTVVAALQQERVTRLPAWGPSPALDLPDLTEAVTEIARTNLLSGPVKLELLDRLAHAPEPNNDYVRLLANSLVRSDTPTGQPIAGAADELIGRIRQPRKPGVDALNRSPNDLVPRGDETREVEPFFLSLHADLQTLSVVFELPDCDTEVVDVGGTAALSIETHGWSTRPLDDFVQLADPTQWPACAVQHTFFREMTHAPGTPPRVEVTYPGDKWQETLREVVDFSFGRGWALMTTDLDVVFFHDNVRVGCTYDFHDSVDHRISVDQGYILVEDIPQRGRRIRTLKQVHFAMGDLPPGFVCPIWSPVTAMLAWACLPPPHP
jgi:hypothetical protein